VTVAALVAVLGSAAIPAGATPLADTQADVPTSGLVAYWSFDEGSGSTAGDSSGNGHTGTLAYSPAWAGAASCRIGGCLSFDGVDDHVKVAHAAQLQLTGDVTVAAWIKPTGRNPGGVQHFQGLIDQVRIYERALTDSEVLALFREA
jgi:hypothetical protein